MGKFKQLDTVMKNQSLRNKQIVLVYRHLVLENRIRFAIPPMDAGEVYSLAKAVVQSTAREKAAHKRNRNL
jgi:hypothetical protein